MEKKFIISKKAPAVIGVYSHAVIANDTCYLSGQIGLNPLTNELVLGFEEEVQQIFENIKVILNDANFSFNNIVKLVIYVTDMENFAKVNSIMLKYFSKPYPARVTIGVSTLPKKAQVEIEVIAIK